MQILLGLLVASLAPQPTTIPLSPLFANQATVKATVDAP